MNAAVAISLDAACQGASHQISEQLARVVGQSSLPSFADEPSGGTDKVSLATDSKRFMSPAEHRARIAAALRRRLYPNTTLHANALAGDINVAPMTVSNWRNGYCDPRSFEMAKLFHYFFAREGGPGFWVEIFGDPHKQP